jgi:hypothetical protein
MKKFVIDFDLDEALSSKKHTIINNKPINLDEYTKKLINAIIYFINDIDPIIYSYDRLKVTVFEKSIDVEFLLRIHVTRLAYFYDDYLLDDNCFYVFENKKEKLNLIRKLKINKIS